MRVVGIDIYCMNPILYERVFSIGNPGKKIYPTIEISKSKNLLGKRPLINVEKIASDITRKINEGKGSHQARIDVDLTMLEVVNELFTEKLVHGLHDSFPFYYVGLRPPVHVLRRHRVIPTESGTRFPLVHKYFSGDVSGVIGESLFAYTAVTGFGVRGILHLRPEKSSLVTPDFVVMDAGGRAGDMERLVGGLCLGGHVGRPSRIFVECKAMSGARVDRERVARGLAQLVWVMRPGDAGLLFMVHRAVERGSYQPFSITVVPVVRGVEMGMEKGKHESTESVFEELLWALGRGLREVEDYLWTHDVGRAWGKVREQIWLANRMLARVGMSVGRLMDRARGYAKEVRGGGKEGVLEVAGPEVTVLAPLLSRLEKIGGNLAGSRVSEREKSMEPDGRYVFFHKGFFAEVGDMFLARCLLPGDGGLDLSEVREGLRQMVGVDGVTDEEQVVVEGNFHYRAWLRSMVLDIIVIGEKMEARIMASDNMRRDVEIFHGLESWIRTRLCRTAGEGI